MRACKAGVRPEFDALHAVCTGPVDGPLHQSWSPRPTPQGRVKIEATKNTHPWARCVWHRGMRAAHPSRIVQDDECPLSRRVMALDVQQITVGLRRTQTIAVFTIHGIDEGHNGFLILGASQAQVHHTMSNLIGVTGKGHVSRRYCPGCCQDTWKRPRGKAILAYRDCLLPW